jgi:hypothetical protein
MQEADRMAERLEAGDPGGAERFQKEIERKRAANLRRLNGEQEQAAREARQCAEPEVAHGHGLPEESV